MHQNELKGPIPESICNLTNLFNLYVVDWILSIPLYVTLCRFRELEKNQLTGPIPESIGNLTSLYCL